MGTGRSRLRKMSAEDFAKAGVTSMNVDVSKFKIYRDNAQVDADHWDATNEFMKNAKKEGLVSAIRAYTGNAYYDMNAMSRRDEYKEVSTEDMIKDLQKNYPGSDTVQRIINVHKALSHSEVPVAFTAYRGSDSDLLVGYSGASFEAMKAMEGEIVRDTGNMSTSMVPGREFSRPVQYTVYFPAGKGIGANIMGFSAFGSGEGEFLTNNGAMFKVLSVKKGKYHDTKVELVWVGRY